VRRCYLTSRQLQCLFGTGKPRKSVCRTSRRRNKSELNWEQHLHGKERCRHNVPWNNHLLIQVTFISYSYNLVVSSAKLNESAQSLCRRWKQAATLTILMYSLLLAHWSTQFNKTVNLNNIFDQPWSFFLVQGQRKVLSIAQYWLWAVRIVLVSCNVKNF